MRHFAFAAALAAALCPVHRTRAAYRSEIIPETTAVRHGLTRPWFTQIQMDRSRARVCDIVLYEGTLYVQTDRAMVHAIEAETGETLWARLVGRPDHPSMTPGVSQDLMAVVNGSRLYVCNRYNGDLLYEVQVDGAPGAGPGISEKRAYVPMISGLVAAYRLQPVTDPMKELGKTKKRPTEEQKAAAEEQRREDLGLRLEYIPPLFCQSLGKALVQPLVTRQDAGEEFVAWPTDRGYLNIGRVDRRREDRFTVEYRLETEAGIAARPTYLPADPRIVGDSGVIYAASRDGFVHAIREKDGEALWRFSTGEPILQPAVVIDQRIYVATQPGGMYCLDAKTGSEHWWTPRVAQFVAAGKGRIYAADRIGRVLVLSAATGTRLDTIDATASPIKLINAETDRLYLATKTGLVQCLRELELSEPIRHAETRQKAPPGEKREIQQKPVEEPVPVPEPGVEEDPFRGGAEDPFGGGAEDPFGGAAAEDNPFDGGAGAGGGAGEDPFGGGAGGGADAGPFAGGDDDPFK